MKLPLPICLTLCLWCVSCERQAQLQHEVTALSATVKQDEAAVQRYETDIAALGGIDAVKRINERIQLKEDQLRPLEFANPIRERSLAAVEAELARLKPAAEAYKAAQPK